MIRTTQMEPAAVLEEMIVQQRSYDLDGNPLRVTGTVSAKEAGYLLSENWDDYDLSEPVMRLPTISPEKLQLKYKEAFRAFYFRPRKIFKKIADMVTLKDVHTLPDVIRRIFS